MSTKNVIVKKALTFSSQNKKNQIAAFAAQAAFFLMMAVFPFVVIFISGVRAFIKTKAELMDALWDFFPENITSIVDNLISEIYAAPFGITLAASIIIAIWSASVGTMAIERGLNFLDGTEDTKNYFVRRITNGLYTIIFCIMLIALVCVYVFGNTIMEKLIAGMENEEFFYNIYFYSKLLAGPVVVFALLLFVYCFLPDKHLKLKTVIPGAVFTTVVWVVLSMAFSWYIEHYGFKTYIYGNLGGIMLGMLWMYGLMYALMIGAELNLVFRDQIMGALGTLKSKITHKKD